MLWYNILNPREWPGVNIKSGNNKIDGVYSNLLSSNHVSFAASGSMFLVANSGIKLISPSFVDTSGFRANRILSENYFKIDNIGNIIPLYSGANNGLLLKLDDNTAYSTNIISYDSEEDVLRFPSASPGAVLYSKSPNKEIASYDNILLNPPSTQQDASIVLSAKVFANSGINLGPNNNLDSYKGFILTHDGSGNVAQWRPATYLRENYDTQLAFDGLERIGINWIRYPKRPAILSNGKIYFYKIDRSWSPYGVFSSLDQIKEELGSGEDTLCVETVKGDVVVGYTKFAFVEKAASQQTIDTGFQNFDNRIDPDARIVDPDNTNPNETDAACWAIDIAPENPNGIPDRSPGGPTNVFVFSVTKGAYFPMQLESEATGPITLRHNDNNILSEIVQNKDDGTELDNAIQVNLTFKPSTANNISVRPNIHTAFNMLGENIDFVIYGKENTLFNNYSSVFNLNENFIPQGLVPVFKIDATIPNSISGSPTGIFYSKFTDREKTKPIGWNFDYSGKVCIKTHDSYVMSSLPSGTGLLNSYADLTVDGYTYSKGLITEDIFLKPIPSSDNTGKYVRNALLTINNEGQIISRTPRVNPTVPDAPSGVVGINNGYGGMGNNEYSIQWTPPENDGRSKIINYIIQFSSNNGENWTNLPTDTIDVLKGFPSQTSATIFQLPVSSIFRVAAQNGVGIGAYSEATENTFVSNTGLPQLPTNFTATRNIDSLDLSDISFSWSASNSWGSYAPSGYLIEESTDNGQIWFNIAFLESNILSYNETGLDGVTNYLYRISAINTNNGKSAYNYVYSTGLLLIDQDLEEEENKRQEELSNFDFGQILFTGICSI
jgi:hypothetical protein